MYRIRKDRDLPFIEGRMLDLLYREEYGFMSPKPDDMSLNIEENYIIKFCAGRVVCNAK